MLKNYMEDMVSYWLPRMLCEHKEKYKAVCKCEECLQKMQLIALNRLPVCCIETSAYSAVKQSREVYGQMLGQVLSAVEEAIGVVDGEVQKMKTGKELVTAHDGVA